jgi:two-component system osmolarity sensor histidine kinase EnvZ
MNFLARLWPRTLLWRTFLLVAMLMLLSVAAWFQIFSTYEREPRARQLAQTLVSVANLTRVSLLSARADARLGLLRELSDREGIHIYPANTTKSPLPDRPFCGAREPCANGSARKTAALSATTKRPVRQLPHRRQDDCDYWLVAARAHRTLLPANGWAAAALLLSLPAPGSSLAPRRPLKTLAAAAGEIGRGRTPPPVSEQGPVEIETLAHAFNQMSADLARLDQDRALILAGISHDLRTPLARLRMSIEMSGMDETTRGETVADIEEMDRSIGQFLDFARTDGGESLQETDLAALLAEPADSARRRGVEVTPMPPRCRLPWSQGLAPRHRQSGRKRAMPCGLPIACRCAGPAVNRHRRRRPRPGIPAAKPSASAALHPPLKPRHRCRRRPGPPSTTARLQPWRADSELGPRDGGGLVATIKLPLNLAGSERQIALACLRRGALVPVPRHEA